MRQYDQRPNKISIILIFPQSVASTSSYSPSQNGSTSSFIYSSTSTNDTNSCLSSSSSGHHVYGEICRQYGERHLRSHVSYQPRMPIAQRLDTAARSLGFGQNPYGLKPEPHQQDLIEFPEEQPVNAASAAETSFNTTEQIQQDLIEFPADESADEVLQASPNGTSDGSALPPLDQASWEEEEQPTRPPPRSIHELNHDAIRAAQARQEAFQRPLENPALIDGELTAQQAHEAADAEITVQMKTKRKASRKSNKSWQDATPFLNN
jgi:hypothetical protein